jgi:hypothetical protein
MYLRDDGLAGSDYVDSAGGGVVSETLNGLGVKSAHRFKPYPVYKDSGIEWLGEIPAHWDVKRLKRVARLNPESLPEDTSPTLETLSAATREVWPAHRQRQRVHSNALPGSGHGSSYANGGGCLNPGQASRRW